MKKMTVKAPEGGRRRTGLPNPWATVPSAEDAALGAGMAEFIVPSEGTETENGPVSLTLFRCMMGLAEARGKIGSADLFIRKGCLKDSRDVSGDYNKYKYAWTIEAGGALLHCRGNEEDRTRNAVWDSNGFSYAVLVRGGEEPCGIADETVSFLAQAVR